MAKANRTQYMIDYIRENQRQFVLKVSRIHDPEMVEWLESRGNVSGYLKELISKDMQRAEEGQK